MRWLPLPAAPQLSATFRSAALKSVNVHAEAGSMTPPGPTNWSSDPAMLAQLTAVPLPLVTTFASQFSALQYGVSPNPLFDEPLGPPPIQVWRPRRAENTSDVPDASSRRNACQRTGFAPPFLCVASVQALEPLAQAVSNRLLQLLTRAWRAVLLQSGVAEPPGDRSRPP